MFVLSGLLPVVVVLFCLSFFHVCSRQQWSFCFVVLFHVCSRRLAASSLFFMFFSRWLAGCCGRPRQHRSRTSGAWQMQAAPSAFAQRQTANFACLRNGCGRPVNPGRHPSGRKFDTCCRDCSSGSHDPDCGKQEAGERTLHVEMWKVVNTAAPKCQMTQLLMRPWLHSSQFRRWHFAHGEICTWKDVGMCRSSLTSLWSLASASTGRG